VLQVHGKGICGTSTWAAARETSKKTNNKCDEEGLEVAVCRHCILLRGLNMFRGEIFAYPLFLQKELATKTNCKFFCTDIMCRYWPYLQKCGSSIPRSAKLNSDEAISLSYLFKGALFKLRGKCIFSNNMVSPLLF